jgi:hypothetical protein
MSGPAHRVQSAVEEFGYPQGHLGHLSPDQENAFTNFKLLCAEHGYYTAAEGDKEASHDDATLLYGLYSGGVHHLILTMADVSCAPEDSRC